MDPVLSVRPKSVDSHIWFRFFLLISGICRVNKLFHLYSLMQTEAAKGFLGILRQYLDTLCSNLRSHTITNVQSNDDKVCVLCWDLIEHKYLSSTKIWLTKLTDHSLRSLNIEVSSFRYPCFWRKVLSNHFLLVTDPSWRWVLNILMVLPFPSFWKTRSVSNQ